MFFETDARQIGILICLWYAEFPELGELLAEQEMDILFVPFWTGYQNAFLRVNTLLISGLSNDCYCGNHLALVPGMLLNENMDIKYSQLPIFPPRILISSFPHDWRLVAQSFRNEKQITWQMWDLDCTDEAAE